MIVLVAIVTEPAGPTTVTTDGSGIYELEGLPCGDYTIQLHVPEGQTTGSSIFDRNGWTFHLKSDDLVEGSFHLQWDKEHGGSRQ